VVCPVAEGVEANLVAVVLVMTEVFLAAAAVA
jgi:hypothetical protein